MDTKKAALVGLAGLAVGFVLGYGSGRVSTGTPVNPLMPTGAGKSSQQETDPAARLRETGQLPPAVTEATTLTGSAVAVDGSRLTFDADLTSFDPTGGLNLPKRRVATLGADTKIVRLAEKTPEEMADDQQAYAKAVSAVEPGTPPLAPPLMYKEIPVAASDIAVGDSVTVEAASDILKAESFAAVRVVIGPKPTTPLAPPPAAPEPTPEPSAP